MSLMDCPRCLGYGFEGAGTGYDSVCSECGGNRQVPERNYVMPTMKMFIWKDAYRVPFGSAIAVAVAENAEEARHKLRHAGVSHYGLAPEEGGVDLGNREPDRVLDLPAAQIFQWSE